MKKLLLSLFVLLLFICQAIAQERTVRGTVKGKEDGLPLPGVSVKVKGSSAGTQTGPNGQFSLRVVGNNSILVFTYVGYATQEVPVGSRSIVNITLASDTRQLGEVIVTGYGTQSRISKTGAISQISSEDVENVPMSSVDKQLQGKIPGLQSVGASGQPGSAQDIRIRGIGSITASSAPLYVVDGIPINSGDLSRNTTTANALSGLNPNDIESITVLKDASAASIYGSRAANGVIIITTKSGKSGKTKVRFDAEYGNASRAFFNDKTRMLTTSENFELMKETLVNGGYIDENTSEADVNDFIFTNTNLSNNTVNTDWDDLVTRTGISQQYNLSLDGGNEKTQFHLSGGYFNQEGTVITSEFKRYNAGVNLKHTINDRFSVGTNLLFSNSAQQGPLNSGYFANPVMAALFLVPTIAPTEQPRSPFNPVELLKMDKNNTGTLKTIGSVYGEYKILPNLKFTSKYGVDYNNLEEDSYQNPFYGDGASVGGSSTRYYTRYFNWVWTNMLDYKWDINKDNNWIANVKLAYEAQKSKYYSLSAYAENLPLNTNYTVPSVGATPITANGTNEGYSFASVFSVADISYKGKYVLSGSFRRDGSSRFGSANRYGNFWSVGATWNMEQEDFIKSLGWINQLKIRSSYGVNGNAGIGNYDWKALYGYTTTYAGTVASIPSSLGNSSLTWEKNKPFDVGVDAAFFKNRLSITTDYYSRTTSDLLLQRPLSLTTGWSSRLENVGAMRNRGFELALSGTPVVAGDFKMDLNFNISFNKNKVTELIIDKQQVSPFIRQVGEDVFSYYLPLYAGVDPQDGSAMWYTDGTRSETTKTYSAASYALTGKSALPKAFGSFGATFSFKGLTLDGTFYYNYGNYLYDPYYQYLNSGGYYVGVYNQRATQLRRWQKAGDITDVPKLDWDVANYRRPSDNTLNSGDFIRLRDVTLSYSLPQGVLSKLKVGSAKVYVRGTNLCTWIKDDDLPYDPEAGGVGGTTNFDINVPKTITFGINLGL